jgi:hypothetical protein
MHEVMHFTSLVFSQCFQIWLLFLIFLPMQKHINTYELRRYKVKCITALIFQWEQIIQVVPLLVWTQKIQVKCVECNILSVVSRWSTPICEGVGWIRWACMVRLLECVILAHELGARFENFEKKSNLMFWFLKKRI